MEIRFDWGFTPVRVTRDYFGQLVQARGLSDTKLQALSSSKIQYPKGTDGVCGFLHDLPRDTVIGILSDFDCDGLMAAVVWYLSLRFMGFSSVLIGKRNVAAGYGLGVSELGSVAGASVVVTSDVGSTARELVSEARRRGIRTVVTDHHLCSPDSSVAGLADYFVNPSCQAGLSFDMSSICGAMVVWLIARRYFELYPEEGSAQMAADLAIVRHFAAIATVSDAMPMRGFNREAVGSAMGFFSYMIPASDSGIVSGLASDPVLQNVLNNFYKFARGLAPEFYTGFDMDFLIYQVIPAFNSVKRMNGSVELVYGALFGSGYAAAHCADRLCTLNRERKELVGRVTESLMGAYDAGDLPFSRVFVLSGIPGGCCGLIAQKMADLTAGPAAVLLEQPDGSFSGSARSFDGYPFLTSVNESEYAHCEGHQEACGIFAGSYVQLAALDSFLEDSFTEYESRRPADIATRPFDVLMDFDADFADFRSRLSGFWRRCQELAPFGPGFAPPRVCLKTRLDNGLFVGFGPGGTSHVRMDLGRGFQCTLWNTDLSALFEKASDGVLYITGTLSRAFINGQYVTDLAGELLTGPLDISDLYEEKDRYQQFCVLYEDAG